MRGTGPLGGTAGLTPGPWFPCGVSGALGLPPHSQATAAPVVPQEPPGPSASMTLLQLVKTELPHISLV